MRISNSFQSTLGAALLPLTLLFACAGEVDGDSSSTRETQVPAEEEPETEEPETEEPEACAEYGDTKACTTASGEVGMASCQVDVDRDFQLYYSACGSVDICGPGDTASCGFGDDSMFAGLEQMCVLRDGAWKWDEFGCSTPLVLSFDNAPVEFTQALGWFDLVGAGLSANHDWVSAKTPWLVLDKNDNGSIDDGSELFGSMTLLASGARAQNGFIALGELDENGDQRVNASDAEFGKLALWRDRNQDRRSSPDELQPLTESGVSALALDYTSRGACTGTACEVERAVFEYTDAAGNSQHGTTIDVHFRLY